MKVFVEFETVGVADVDYLCFTEDGRQVGAGRSSSLAWARWDSGLTDVSPLGDRDRKNSHMWRHLSADGFLHGAQVVEANDNDPEWIALKTALALGGVRA